MNLHRQTLRTFCIGGALYSLIEIAARGYTHWSMTLTGGLCFTLLHRLNLRMKHRPLALRCALGAGLITAMEFSVGLIVNRWLRWNVWDYSDRAFNLLGQVCPRFTLYWFLLCIPAFSLSALLERRWQHA